MAEGAMRILGTMKTKAQYAVFIVLQIRKYPILNRAYNGQKTGINTEASAPKDRFKGNPILMKSVKR